MESKFIIPLNGLASGKTEFNWKLEKEFFRDFENSEVLDAELDAGLTVTKIGSDITVDLLLDGTITVECDRCLEDLVMPIREKILFTVVFDETEEENSDTEVIFLPKDSSELDMSQVIYDFSCLALPIQRFHPEGGCNKGVVEILEEGINNEENEVENNPFSKLGGMFKN